MTCCCRKDPYVLAAVGIHLVLAADDHVLAAFGFHLHVLAAVGLRLHVLALVQVADNHVAELSREWQNQLFTY